MKKLFVVAALCLAPLAGPVSAAPKKSTAKVAKVVPAPPPAPPVPLARKPGFWERAWDGTKTGSKKVWSATTRTVTRPFGGKSSKEGESQPGWRDLSITLVLDPTTVKLPETRTLRVKVSVVNRGKNAVQFDFPSAQRVAVLILDDSGKVRTRASDSQKGDPEQGFLIINPDERLEYSASLPTTGLSAAQTYTLEAIFPDFPELRARVPLTPVR